MIAKYTYKDIKENLKDTPAEYNGKTFNELPYLHAPRLIGTYKKPSANWWYQVYAAYNGVDKSVDLCVVVFGHIVIE